MLPSCRRTSTPPTGEKWPSCRSGSRLHQHELIGWKRCSCQAFTWRHLHDLVKLLCP